MKRPVRQPDAYSKVSGKNRTVLPRTMRDKLGIKPGDTLRYRVTEDGILLDKASSRNDGPFATFSEWSREADDKAYGSL